MDRFSNLIGQQAVKNKLNFYIDVFEKKQTMPFLLFTSPKGYGKTEFARNVGKNLEGSNGAPRPFLEINSSIIRNNNTFFENIFLQFMLEKEITILFDEAHNLPNDFTQLLLTICNTDSNPVRNIPYDGTIMTFDFTKITFIFATTEPDKLFPPLKDRMEPIEFKPYTEEELSKIMAMNLDKVKISQSCIQEVISRTRGNPRSAVRMAKNINDYCIRDSIPEFSKDDFLEMCKIFDILPHGISQTERSVLEVLQERGESSLTTLTAVTGMSKTSLQRDVEHYLIKKNFMSINPVGSKRSITRFGKKVLENVG